jgi:hypothetical protein
MLLCRYTSLQISYQLVLHHLTQSSMFINLHFFPKLLNLIMLFQNKLQQYFNSYNRHSVHLKHAIYTFLHCDGILSNLLVQTGHCVTWYWWQAERCNSSAVSNT